MRSLFSAVQRSLKACILYDVSDGTSVLCLDDFVRLMDSSNFSWFLSSCTQWNWAGYHVPGSYKWIYFRFPSISWKIKTYALNGSRIYLHDRFSTNQRIVSRLRIYSGIYSLNETGSWLHSLHYTMDLAAWLHIAHTGDLVAMLHSGANGVGLAWVTSRLTLTGWTVSQKDISPRKKMTSTCYNHRNLKSWHNFSQWQPSMLTADRWGSRLNTQNCVNDISLVIHASPVCNTWFFLVCGVVFSSCTRPRLSSTGYISCHLPADQCSTKSREFTTR